MALERMNREQFLAKVGTIPQDRLPLVLWNLYWRGPAAFRERIEAELQPPAPGKSMTSEGGASAAALGSVVLNEVSDFVRTARSGAYLGGSRLVSKKDRAQWRVIFRRLVNDALDLLGKGDVTHGATALEALVDLACDATEFDFFHSEDPVAAMRLVVSDAVAALWKARLQQGGFSDFAHHAAPQLLRWERAWGWTRRGEAASVVDRERPLAEVLEQMLRGHDAWMAFSDAYLGALQLLAEPAPLPRAGKGRQTDAYRVKDLTERHRREAERRAWNLQAWHLQLLDRLLGSEEEDRLVRLVGSTALRGPDLDFLGARLAWSRNDRERARALMTACLKARPGDDRFRQWAVKMDLQGSL